SLALEAEDSQALLDALPLIGFLMEIRYDDPRIKLRGKDLLDHIMNSLEIVMLNILSLIQNRGKRLTLIADDLQEIDDASSQLLEHLIAKLTAHPVLLICLYRLDFELPEYILKYNSFQEMEITALSLDQIHQLLQQYTQGLELSEQTLNQVLALSNGNPFFLEEWCNYISHLPATGEHAYPVPGNLHALILSRLDNLPGSLRLLLHKASVIGHEFFVEILREVENRLHDPVNVETTLVDLENHSLIMKMLGYDFSTYFFKHMTTREVAYQTLLQQNRRMLHQLTAETIEYLFSERLDEFVYVLADHYLKAELPEQALPYLEKAFTRASGVYDNILALKYGGILLDLLPNTEALQKATILVQCADINWLMGNWDAAWEN
ncbi:MAG TPA: hypothetical protein PKI59_08695, partial [Candidatus Cloacimonadota bacterium]|nr:hypothetical protein [Candidatus Cloacimonadota bacterium]